MKFMNLEFAFSGFQESCGDLIGFRLAVRVPRDTWADNIQRRRRLFLSHVLGLSPLALTSQLAFCPEEVIKPTDRVMPRRVDSLALLSFHENPELTPSPATKTRSMPTKTTRLPFIRRPLVLSVHRVRPNLNAREFVMRTLQRPEEAKSFRINSTLRRDLSSLSIRRRNLIPASPAFPPAPRSAYLGPVPQRSRAINEKILSVDYSEFRAEIKTVDAQESLDGGIVVLVTGYLTGKDNVKRNFTQSFFLATQDKGYYVLNDIFRYVDDGNDQWESGALTSGDRAPLAPEQGFDGTLEQQQEAPPKQDQQVTEAPEEVELNEGEVFNSPEIEDAPTLEEEAPTIQMIDEVAKISQTAVADSGSAAILEGAPKKSYASIVRVCP
ncbi:hypothetical protein BHE74_00024397 [Ensete ventricosum]|nr:hypothetical protein BHE74_00024397 [Ensete ventricosum]